MNIEYIRACTCRTTGSALNCLTFGPTALIKDYVNLKLRWVSATGREVDRKHMETRFNIWSTIDWKDCEEIKGLAKTGRNGKPTCSSDVPLETKWIKEESVLHVCNWPR